MTRRNLLAALLLCFYGGIYFMTDKKHDDKDPKGGQTADAADDTPAPQDPPTPPTIPPTEPPSGGTIEGGK